MRRGPTPPFVALCSWALLLLAAVPPPAGAGSTHRALDDAARIQASADYRSAVGEGSTLAQARDDARYQLVASIRSLVAARVHAVEAERDSRLTQEYEADTRVLAVLQLEGLELLELPRQEGQYRCLAYVAEADLQAGLTRQRQRLRTLVRDAVAAADSAELDVALRLTYWAYLLAHTVDTLTVDLPGIQVADPCQALMESLHRLVQGVQLTAGAPQVEADRVVIPVTATYAGRPATLGISLYTGAGMDFPRLDHGQGYIELHRDPLI